MPKLSGLFLFKEKRRRKHHFPTAPLSLVGKFQEVNTIDSGDFSLGNS
jgi:hypothetical protein